MGFDYAKHHTVYEGPSSLLPSPVGLGLGPTKLSAKHIHTW
jgi:hypothetical protein